jgi:hypothetical protein
MISIIDYGVGNISAFLNLFKSEVHSGKTSYSKL